MTLTPSEVASIGDSLSRWERVEYVAEFLVFAGCAGEIIAPKITCLNRHLKESIERWSSYLLLAALILSLIALLRTNTLSGSIVDSIGGVAKQAVIDASDAKDSAKAAGISATEAGSVGDAAKKKSDAVGLEVNAAEKKVEKVDKRATQIDQALGMAQYLLSDRDIRDPNGLKAKLSKFSGKTILFRSYVNDGDGYFLCKELDWLASSAGIIPIDQCGLFTVEPPYPMTQINVFAPDDETMLSLELVLSGATAFGASSGPAGNAPHASAIIVFIGRKNRAFVGETAQTRDAEKRAAAMKKEKPNPPK